MARLKIIVLEVSGRDVHYALWADVPEARQPFYADATKVSAWKDALAADNTALQNGSVVEEVRYSTFNSGETLAQIKAALVIASNDFQANTTAHNPWGRYGTVWDGTSWTNGGVA